jgi:RNA polymerase-binding transcription factor DksA
METKAKRAERRRIQEEIDSVNHELRNLDVKLENKPEWSLGEGDPSVHEWEMNYALKKEVERRLQSLQIALQKLEHGSYAICEVCGKPIDPERLAILPETTRCVDCARKRTDKVTR